MTTRVLNLLVSDKVFPAHWRTGVRKNALLHGLTTKLAQSAASGGTQLQYGSGPFRLRG